MTQNAPTNTRDDDFMPNLVAKFLTKLVRIHGEFRGIGGILLSRKKVSSAMAYISSVVV